jgi:DNA-binding transcriptional regulator YiaG
MARLKAFNPAKIQENRKISGMNQYAYWSRFGITQSGGSRYESGRNIPMPTSMLMRLLEAGRITEQDIVDAMKAVKATK